MNKHYIRAENKETGNPNCCNYISYWDENNLYENALSQLLPCSNFEWLTRHEVANLDWSTIDTEGEFGYALMVDLEYPDNIHDKTQDFPLAPESGIVTEDMLIPYMSDLWNARCELCGQPESFKPEKNLLMKCRNKKEYIVHFKVLKFYLNMGMRITSIHKVVRYNQAAIFKDYINNNSAKRQAATNEFEKDLYKLLNNALFGKSMENVRGRKKYNLRNSEESMLKDTSKPHYLHSHRFAEDLVLN